MVLFHPQGIYRFAPQGSQEVEPQENQALGVMKLIRTTHFERNYAKAPQQVQRAFDKTVVAVASESPPPLAPRQEIRREPRPLAARASNKDWRFYFLIQNDGYLIVNIISHPK